MMLKLATRFAQARKKKGRKDARRGSHAKTREENLTQRRQDAKVKWVPCLLEFSGL
jgi:hypothetical protein